MPCSREEGKRRALALESMESEEELAKTDLHHQQQQQQQHHSQHHLDVEDAYSATSTPLLNGLHYSVAVSQPPVYSVAGFPYGEGGFDDTRPSSHLSQRSDANDCMLAVEADTRQQRRTIWSNQVEFILACIGYTVGLGNIWRFPYLCYKSGGGAFMVPYLVMLCICGIPLLYMELAVGQYTRLGPVGALEKICPLFKGAGLATVVISFLICTYYNVILAWTLFYLFNSLRGDLPWTKCHNKWNTPYCWDKYSNQSTLLQVNETKTPAQEFYDHKVLEISDGIDKPGDIRLELVLALFVAWVLIYFAIWKSVRSSGKVVYITATFPYVFMIAFLVRSLMLEGALEGILYFIKPQWEKLLDVRIWVNAAAQNFSSIGIAFGTLIAYASYNKFNNNILRDTLAVGLIDALTSILSGLVVFATIGHVAQKYNRPIDNIISEGPGVIFVVYPEVLSRMPLPQIWASLFFCLLLFLGLDSQFAMVEVVVTSLQDACPKCIKKFLRHHEVLVLLVCLFSFGCGLPNVTQGGIYVFQLIDYYTAAISLMYLAFFEVIAVVWFYGAGRLSRNIREMTGRLPSLYMRLCWWVAAPVLILIVWAYSLMDYKPLTYDKTYRYPDWAEALGWGLAFISVGCIPGYAIKALCTARGRSCWEKLRNTIQSQLGDDISENPETSCYSLRMSGSRSSATAPPDEGVPPKQYSFHEMVKVEQIISTV